MDMHGQGKISKFNKLSGFTLVELLVVISIIGLVASAVLYNLESAKMKGRDAKRIQDVENIVKALFLYEAQTGQKMGPGSGCGDNGNGFGWFSADSANTAGFPSPVLNYPQSIAECLVSAGAAEGLIKDPLESLTSNTTAGYTYMVGNINPVSNFNATHCTPGKTRYVYAKLEGRASNNSATNNTCEQLWDSCCGMNYFKKFE